MTSAAERLRAIPSWQVTLGVALLALGFLIAAQLASEGPRVRYTTQERTPLVETATGLQTEQDGLKTRILQIRAQIQAIESEGEGAADLVKQLNARLEQARIAAGLIALTGSGIVLQLEDSKEPVPPGGSESDYLVGSRDIRAVVEQLWGAGAEAIAVNGERITPTSAIIDIGSSLLVNSAYLAPPYQVSALGPADLYDRLSASPGFVDFVRARSDGYGIRVSIAEPQSVDIPAFVGTVTLRYSRPLASPVGRTVRDAQQQCRAVDHAPTTKPAHDRGGGLRARPARRRPAPVAGRRHGPCPAVRAGPDRPGREPQRPQRRPAHGGGLARSGAGDARPEPLARRRLGRRDQRRSGARPRLRRARPGQPDRGSRSRSTARSTGRVSRSSSTSCATPVPRRSRSARCGW